MTAPAPYRARLERVQAALGERGLDALLDLAAVNVAYLTGFVYNPTERPAGILVPRTGEPVLLLPLLDIDQVRAESWVDRVETYFEFPGTEHPVTWIGGCLGRLGLGRATVGIDPGALTVASERRLREALPGATLRPAGDVVPGLRLTKDPGELALIREAAGYADLMQEIGLAALRQGRAWTELDLLNEILGCVNARLAAELPEVVAVKGMTGGTVVSGVRTALPHGLTTKRPLRRGEPVMLSFGCAVGGYRAENTRTYFLGPPTPELREMARLVVDTQEAGRAQVGPGVAARAVNASGLARLRAAGQGQRIRHRVGHGLGLEGHEPPWLEEGDPTVLAPGMVVSVEPGLYDGGLGGFLIADTVEVTADGARSLTASPRRLAEVTVDG